MVIFALYEVGALILMVCGFILWKREKIKMLHYFYAKKNNKINKKYARIFGKNCFILGLVLFILGIFRYYEMEPISYIILLIGLLLVLVTFSRKRE